MNGSIQELFEAVYEIAEGATTYTDEQTRGVIELASHLVAGENLDEAFMAYIRIRSELVAQQEVSRQLEHDLAVANERIADLEGRSL